MRLLEFFSVSNAQDPEEESKEEIKKDLMAFILDDDDVYKTKLLPLVKKLQSSQDEEALKKDFLEVVNDCCLKFYKEQEFTHNPNKIFPLSMRREAVEDLIKVYKNSFKKDKKNKDENQRSII